MTEWTTPGLEVVTWDDLASRLQRLVLDDLFGSSPRARKVETVRLVSYGPCSDPLPHLQILAPPLDNP